MKLIVIGTGYVGLCQGAAFSDVGHDVTCVDIIEEKVKMLNNFSKGISNQLPIFEPGLPDLIKKNCEAGRLKFTTSLKDGIKNADVVFIAVGTPPNEEGKADLTALKKVCESIGKTIEELGKEYTVVATKSTVPVNTHKVVIEILSQNTTKQFSVVSNPEFLAQGRAVKDCIKPSRIVIGTNDEKSKDIMMNVYKPYERQSIPIYLMSNVDAELHKYAANSYLAAQISLTNNFANLARTIGADWNKVKKAVLADVRVGDFVHSSPGFGGSCFEKDVEEFTHSFEKYGCDNSLLKEVLRQNRLQKQVMGKKVKDYFGNLNGKTIAVWGLSFKPETDDMRCSPSIPLLKTLVKEGARVKAFDPAANEESKKIFVNFEGKDSIEYVHDKYDALEGADALVLMTEWREFRTPDFKLIKQKLNRPLIFDGRDIYTSQEIKENGFEYSSIGKPDIK